ncbi:MAG TPA: sensor histidine kinase [Chloroflexia bacterium]|nr:sensor histidine kinase [Chloroflexia bacterium]
MPDDQTKQEAPLPAQWKMPVAIDSFLVLYYFVTWISIAGYTAAALADAPGQTAGLLPPAALYGVLLLSFPVLNWRRYRRERSAINDLLWGYDDQRIEQIVYVLVDFALIGWLSALNPTFTAMYFLLYGHTWGILHWNGRLAFAMVAAEIVAHLYQLGLIPLFITEKSLPPEFWIYTFAIASCLVYGGMIMRLIRSRIESEILVHELRQTKQQLEEALAKEKEVAVLRERNRMAREMHDVLGHALSLVAVKIEAAQRLQAVDPARAAAELEATKTLVRESMIDLRASLVEMRSPELEAGEKALDEALREWATRTGWEAGLAVECAFEPDVAALPPPIQDALWRVGREAVLNTVKHARARRIEIHLFRKDNMVYLSVADDGVGIPHLGEGTARLEGAGHYGVRGMRERLEALGGRLTMRPNPDGQGTLVLAGVPLPPAESPPPVRLRDRLSPARNFLFGKGEHS